MCKHLQVRMSLMYLKTIGGHFGRSGLMRTFVANEFGEVSRRQIILGFVFHGIASSCF